MALKYVYIDGITLFILMAWQNMCGLPSALVVSAYGAVWAIVPDMVSRVNIITTQFYMSPAD